MTNPSDLFALLDIKPEAVKAVRGIDPAKPGTDRTVAAVSSPFALKLDEWDIDRGRQCVIESRHFENLPWAEQCAADFHAVYWQANPVLDDDTICADPQRSAFLSGLLSSPEYHALHQQTTHAPYESMIAATTLAQAYSNARQVQDGSNDGDQCPNAANGELGGLNDLAGLVAVTKAVREAQEDIDTLTSLRMACGWDMASKESSTTDQAALMDAFARAKDDPALRRVMELAGKYRRCAQSQQRSKTGHGHDEFVGVELDNDISRLLPVELGKLGDEDLELDMLRRFAERQTLCREHVAPEPQGHGPIVVCLDESGSMRGEKIAQAKAFALAMAWIARHQNRYCLLVAFSDERTGRVLCLEPGKWDQAKVIDWLTAFEGGGTSLECPLATVPGVYWSKFGVPSGKTDMVLITDGIVPIDHGTRTRFNQWKQDQRCQLTTLVIGERYSGALGSVSDTVHNISTFELAEASVRDCLSI